jgi:phosphopentomutase
VSEPLGRRESFADIAATIGHWLGVGQIGPGRGW